MQPSPGCLLFHEANSNLGLLQGAGVSLPIADGAVLWSFGGATLADGTNVTPGVLASVTSDSASGCFPDTTIATTPSFALSPLGSQSLITPLDMVQVGDMLWSYYQLFRPDSQVVFGYDSAGFGIAPWDAATHRFVPTAGLLWASDGPSFGTTAVVQGSMVYVYGCAPNANGESDCYLGEVDGTMVDEPAAYQYALGGGFFTPNVADALPVLTNVTSPQVRGHASGRWFVTWAPAVGSGLMIASALGPTGPFSQPQNLLTCELGTSDFCVGGSQHPELDPDANTFAVSCAASSFNGTPPGERYWPRLVFAPIPEGLP
jgi:hypothetical protein